MKNQIQFIDFKVYWNADQRSANVTFFLRFCEHQVNCTNCGRAMTAAISFDLDEVVESQLLRQKVENGWENSNSELSKRFTDREINGPDWSDYVLNFESSINERIELVH